MAFEANKINVYEYEYDFSVDGGATGVYDLSAKANKADLPVGAVRLSSSVIVQEAFTGSGASAKFGTTASDVDLAANAAVATWVDNYIVNDTTPIVVTAANVGDCIMTVGGAALTAGKAKVIIQFYVPTSL